MAWAKIERLITLMNVLLGSPRPVSAAELRERVPGYGENQAAFRRTFERDKGELRRMGVPLLVETVPGTDPPEQGYRIRQADYALRDPGLEPEELEALNLASAVVGSMGEFGRQALFKLGAAPADRPAAAEIPADPDLVAAFTGVAERRPVTFAYRGQARLVHPYRLRFARGRWYLNGHDHTRDAQRWFRLNRVEDAVVVAGEPGAFTRPDDARSDLQLDPWAMGDGDGAVDAEVWFDPEVAATVRSELATATVVRDDGSGLVVRLTVSNREAFRSWLLSFLDRAEVLGPPELRDEVVAWLTEVSGG